jgi:hypothetical protein
VQSRRRRLRADRGTRGEQYRAGVQPGVHLHDRDAGLGVAREDGALDRRGATPARQQRSVHVEAAEPRCRQNRLRQDQAVGRHHRGVEIKLREPSLLAVVAQRGRRSHRQSTAVGVHVHRRSLQSVAAAGRARRLRIDSGHLVSRVKQRRERRQ